MIVYPAIDIHDGRCVMLEQGDFDKKNIYAGDPAAAALRWQNAGARWLHVVDLDGAKKGQPVNDSYIKAILESVTIPVQVGGGNRTLDDIESRLSLGAARVIIGTAVLQKPKMLREAAEKFGDRIAVGVDALNGKVAVSAWQSVTETKASELLESMSETGIKTVIYTDISCDGMMRSPNFEMYGEAARSRLDIIASGGVSSLSDVARLSEMNVSGVIIGTALYSGAIELTEVLKLYDR